MKRLLLFLGLGSMLGACSTDFDINGPYEQVPIILGILDHNDTTHYIKVTRSFQTNENAFTSAAIPDSNYFNSVVGTVTEYIDNMATGRSWNLKDTIITTKEDGAWYGPEQKLYVFNASDLDEDGTYKLELSINEGAIEIDAETELIGGASFASQTSTSIAFATATSSEPNGTYPNNSIGYHRSDFASRYNLSLDLFYYDFTSANDSIVRKITYQVGEEQYTTAPGQNSEKETIDGEVFYQWIASQVPVDPNLVKRKFGRVDVKLSMAHSNFDRFMDVVSPSSSVVQNKPDFTNINGGKGLFSSRHTIVQSKQLTNYSMKELCIGQYTGDLGFCSSKIQDAGKTYYCPN